MKLMKHPDHGWHHCYSDEEEAELRKNGWVDANEQKEPEKVVKREKKGKK